MKNIWILETATGERAETWHVHEAHEPLAQDDLCLLQEEFSTGLEDACRYVRFECLHHRIQAEGAFE